MSYAVCECACVIVGRGIGDAARGVCTSPGSGDRCLSGARKISGRVVRYFLAYAMEEKLRALRDENVRLSEHGTELEALAAGVAPFCSCFFLTVPFRHNWRKLRGGYILLHAPRASS